MPRRRCKCRGLTTCVWHDWVANAKAYAMATGGVVGAITLIATLSLGTILAVPKPDGYGRPLLGTAVIAAHVLPPLAYGLTRLVRRIRTLRRESFEWVDE
jgi:uncharacterized protein (DUF1684 family)